jgi:hypothetical protein
MDAGALTIITAAELPPSRLSSYHKSGNNSSPPIAYRQKVHGAIASETVQFSVHPIFEFKNL